MDILGCWNNKIELMKCSGPESASFHYQYMVLAHSGPEHFDCRDFSGGAGITCNSGIVGIAIVTVVMYVSLVTGKR